MPTSARGALARSLCDALASSLSSGDGKLARVSLAALQGLVADLEICGASVVDLGAERKKRGG